MNWDWVRNCNYDPRTLNFWWRKPIESRHRWNDAHDKDVEGLSEPAMHKESLKIKVCTFQGRLIITPFVRNLQSVKIKFMYLAISNVICPTLTVTMFSESIIYIFS
jgi:hypothetical protein